jgi:hypothetical protein
MDAERFDAWTRRPVGLAVASAFGALIGLAAAPEAGAAKKTRCRKAGGACTRREDCCGFLSCDTDGVCRAIVSDRALKANVGSVDPADMLARVRDLPIATWNYTSDDPAIRHIGPMAQDFAALFNVGDDDRHIHPLDGQGVALAAIQGLAEELARLRAENAGLAERLAALEAERPGSSLP